MIKFDSEEFIDINNKSSEWIGIDLPAQTHMFIDYSGDFMYPFHYKRIKTKTGVVWRVSYVKGSWTTHIHDNILKELDNIYKKYLYNLRENKLKRVLNKKD